MGNGPLCIYSTHLFEYFVRQSLWNAPHDCLGTIDVFYTLGNRLGRPKNERPFLLIPVGYPAPEAKVPDIEKRTLDEVREVR